MNRLSKKDRQRNAAILRKQFYLDLLDTDLSTTELLAKYDNRQQLLLRLFIKNYFDRIMDVHSHIYCKFGPRCSNYGLLGSRFQKFVLEFASVSKFFSTKSVKKYSNYFGQYGDCSLNLDKIEILTSRIYQNHTLLNNSTNSNIDYKMAVYEDIDDNKLFAEISSMSNVLQQLNYFIKKISLSQEGTKILYDLRDFLQSALRANPEFAKMSPKLLPFGGLVNGLGMYDSDIDMVVKLQQLPQNFMECATLRQNMLEVIEFVLKQKIRELQTVANLIVPSKKVPLVKLDFEEIPRVSKQVDINNRNGNLCYNSVDLNLNGVCGPYNSAWLKFLTEYDRRFKVLTLVLKYFAKKSELIESTMGFSSYSFTLMIIYFLENTKPAVLPTFDKLQSLASEPIWVKGQNFAFCDDLTKVALSTNQNSVPELLVKFFHFYKNFNFTQCVFDVRNGAERLKKDYFQDSKLANLNKEKIVFLDPFSGTTNITDRVSYANRLRWENVVSTIDRQINEHNCVQLLTNPQNLKHWSEL